MSQELIKSLKTLRTKANYYEGKDLHGNPVKKILKMNPRKFWGLVVAILLGVITDKGFSKDFLSFISSVLSILIRLFMTAIIFAADKLAVTTIPEYPTSRQRYSSIVNSNFFKLFISMSGYNIVRSIVVLIIVSLCSLYGFEDTISIHSEFKDLITIEVCKNVFQGSLFNLCIAKLLFVLFLRVTNYYLLFSIIYSTLFAVSSLVPLSIFRHNEENVNLPELPLDEEQSHG